MIKSTLICDSIHRRDRITTFELEYPRFIHSELMTHRMFSRNAMSSRAIPVDTMIKQVLTAPAMPVEWGLNKSGMQSEGLSDQREVCVNTWTKAAVAASVMATELKDLGLHKQIVNRVLEPYQLMKTVVTATEWYNFFELRTHKDTQPEFQVLAKLMKEQYDLSTPKELGVLEWHLPYVDTYNCIEDALKISSSCCAQVSYRKSDDSLDKAYKIYDRLVESKPAHLSPFEHQAKPLFNYHYKWDKGITHKDRNGDSWSGNFKGWIQHRQLLDL
jgi:thymidylate synthase ThyX